MRTMIRTILFWFDLPSVFTADALLNLIFCAASIPVLLNDTPNDGAPTADSSQSDESRHGRRLIHRRAIDVQVFVHSDERFWDLDVTLQDTKTRAFELASGPRAAGQPIHSMLLRLTIDTEFNVVDANAQTLAAPYPGYCEDYGDAYRSLIGLNLLRGFTHAVKQRLHGVLGCTHITELTRVLPTAAIQAFAGEVVRPEAGGDQQPFQLDRCHALRLDGPAVLRYYPRWSKPVRQDATGAAPDMQPQPEAS